MHMKNKAEVFKFLIKIVQKKLIEDGNLLSVEEQTSDNLIQIGSDEIGSELRKVMPALEEKDRKDNDLRDLVGKAFYKYMKKGRRNQLREDKYSIDSRTLGPLFELAKDDDEKIIQALKNRWKSLSSLSIYVGFVGWKGFFLERSITIHEYLHGDMNKAEMNKTLNNSKSIKEQRIRNNFDVQKLLQWRKLSRRIRTTIIMLAAAMTIIALLPDNRSIIVKFFQEDVWSIFGGGNEAFPDDVNGILVLTIDRDDHDNLRSDLIETINRNSDPSLKVKARESNIKLNTELGDKAAHEQAKRVGKKYNARIVIWGKMISDKKKFYPYISIVDDEQRNVFFKTNEINMDDLDVSEYNLPSILIDKPEAILTFITGYIAYNCRDLDKALDCFMRIKELGNMSEIRQVNLLILIGNCYFKRYDEKKDSIDYKQAEEYYKLAISISPHETDAYINLSGLYLRNGEFEKALEYSKIGVSQHYIVIDKSTKYLAHAYFGLDSIDKAIKFFTILTEADPNDSYSRTMIGTCYFSKKNYELAIKHFDISTAIYQGDDITWSIKGMANYRLGNLKQAKKCFTKSLRINDRDYQSWFTLGNIFANEDLEKSTKCFLEAAKINPFQYYIWSNIANNFYKNGDKQNAIKYIKKSLTVDSIQSESWTLWAKIFEKENNFKEVIKCYIQALKYSPDNWEIMHNLGLAYYNIENLDMAIQSCEASLALNKNNTRSWHQLGKIYHDQGNYRSSVNAINEAIRINPLDYQNYYKRGLSQLQMKDDSCALISFSEAVKLNQSDFFSWCALGDLFLENNKFIEARNAFLKATNLRPDEFLPWCRLGTVYTVLDEKKLAFRCYDKAKDLKSNSAQLDFVIAMSHLHFNNQQQSKKLFLSLNMNNSALAFCYLGLGHIALINEARDEAIAFYKKAKKEFANDETFNIFFNRYYKLLLVFGFDNDERVDILIEVN